MTTPDDVSQVPAKATGRALVGRVGASVIDQGLSTATNLFITLVAARALGVRDFGAFGVVYLVATAVAGSMRAALGSTVLIFQDEAADDDSARPFGAALAIGLTASAGIVVAASVAGGDLRAPLLALAATLPGILVQDTGRVVEFTALQPVKALVLDVIWAVTMVVGLVLVSAFASLTPATLVLVWGGSGTISGIWTLWVHGRRLPRPSLRWFHHCWGFAWRYLAVFASTLGVFQVTTLLLGGIAGVEAVGAVRATQVLFGPIQNVATGLMVAFVPDTSPDTPLREHRNRLFFVSGLLMAVAGIITVVASVLPDSLGEMILGDSWYEAKNLILPAGLAAVLFGLTSGAVVGLRAARAAHESLVVSLQICAFQFALPLAGAVVGNEFGYMWALTATWVIATALWWRSYALLERAGLSAASEPPA